ncbi:MAG TPA: DUF819 family protein [Bacteroidales bacterium]|nr:DUF819 family protein [Bacteroidales bacterium]
MKLIILSLFYLVSPYLIILLTKRYKILDRIGAVLLCYALGFIIGLTDILPEGSEKVQEIFTSATIPLALPLLLFGSQVKQWVKLAGRTLLSMLLAVVSLIGIVTAVWLAFGEHLPESWQVGGLLIGLYTGGTPNLASIQTALDITPEVYLMVNTYDIFLSAVFLLLIMSSGSRLLSWLLPKYKEKKSGYHYKIEYNGETPDPYDGFFKKAYFPRFMIAFGVAAGIAAVSAGLSFLLTGGISMLVVILSITTLSLAGSAVPALNRIKKSFEGGMYLILVFSITVASMVNAEDFINLSPALFWFVASVIFGTFVLHILISAIFKVDTDTTIITATAMICSPPFVPVVAGVLKNKQIIISGLTVGIIGYAIGNYLGVLMAVFLRSLGG